MFSRPYIAENLERRVLRALCAHPGGAKYPELLANLTGYKWRDEEHMVIYGAMHRIGSLPVADRQRELASEATRMGFPDIDCSVYFKGETATSDELAGLIQQIRELQ
jgi:hypothetical protein